MSSGDNVSKFHLFCLCGQKMRLNETMFGRKGRCISCRLKIRTPHRAEIADGVREIHLKDHPEFIRENSPEEAERASSIRHAHVSVPIDTLEPLMMLCSAGKRLRKELEFTRSANEKKTLKAHRSRLKKVRAELDNDIHERLMESAIELTSIQEKLADCVLSARVGEIEFAEYREKSTRLRWRRESLEKRQVNLRAWGRLSDPDLAGGYIEVAFSDIERITPKAAPVNISVEPGAVLPWMAVMFRNALSEKELAKRKLDEIKRHDTGGPVSVEKFRRVRVSQKAIRARAAQSIRFWRGRLEAFLDDVRTDEQVINEQLKLMPGRRQLAELRHENVSQTENQLLNARDECKKDKAFIKRLIAAQASSELPPIPGMFSESSAGISKIPGKSSAWIYAVVVSVILGLAAIGVILGALLITRFSAAPISGPERVSIRSERTIEQPRIPEPPQPDTAPPEPAPAVLPSGNEIVEDLPIDGETETSDPESAESSGGAMEAAIDYNAIRVELRGIVNAEGRPPRFSIRITSPDGTHRDIVRELKSSIAEIWTIREFNPGLQTITLYNGQEITILRRGEEHELKIQEG